MLVDNFQGDCGVAAEKRAECFLLKLEVRCVRSADLHAERKCIRISIAKSGSLVDEVSASAREK